MYLHDALPICSVRTQERVAGALAGQADGNAGLAIGAQRIDLRDTRRQRRVAGIDRKREAAVGLGVLMRTAHRGIGWQRGQSLQRRQHLRSEEHTSELQSLMRISYAAFC